MKILCAVDESDFSRFAVQAIGTLFRSVVKEIVLLHVIDNRLIHHKKHFTTSEIEALSGISKKIEQQGQKLLHGFSERLITALELGKTGSMPRIKPLLVKGHVSDTIMQWSEKVGTDCIALGSRGIRDVPGYLLGSVSRKVVTHATSSVFMVKAPVTLPLPVTLALDGSKSSKFAARTVQAWLNPEDISLGVVSVVPNPLTDLAPQILSKRNLAALMKPFRRRTQELLDDYRVKFLKAGYQVRTECVEGRPPEQILEAAERQHAQLVCMGSKGLSGVERFTLGSVSEWVSTYAPSSVLVVRH
jgi:nucleotide-binding universal stress UspA family protein